MAYRVGILLAGAFLSVSACGGSDEFMVDSGEAGDGDSAGDGVGDGDTSPGGDGDTSPGTGGGQAGDGDASGGGENMPTEWVGDRIGPTVADSPSPDVGGMNADLPAPGECEELPVGGCMHFTGVRNEEAIEGSCVASSFTYEGGFLACEGEDFSFGANLPGFTGAPPSTFDIPAFGMEAPNIAFSLPRTGFESHDDANEYLLAESYELATRASGAVYELVEADETRVPFVAMKFSVTFTPRPTCGGCAKIRILGNLSAPIIE